MKKLNAILLVVSLFLATQAFAGSLMVNGNLSANSNLTAQSISLGGVTETNWDFLPLQGYKYVIVHEGTNDIQRGNNLKTAYSIATTLSPTASNRVVVLVPPGSYSFGTTGLVMSTSYVDLVGLVPAQMTSRQVFTNTAGGLSVKTVANVQCPVRIYSAVSGSSGTLVQNVDNVRIESVILTNTSTGVGYYPSVSGSNTVMRHVAMNSMLIETEYAGQYSDCVASDNSFGGDDSSVASGTFIDCVAGTESFAQGTTSGTFIGCTAENGSFGTGSLASGVFINCVGNGECFGGDGTASGTFIGCFGGDYSFGGDGGGTVGGTFICCISGNTSFNIDPLNPPRMMRHCQAGAGSFGDLNMASNDFNYNVGGTNTFLMLPQLPSSTTGLPSGTVWSSNGVLRVSP